jgi:ADP-L-glycero-D-manno-heptose 6-epimerase
MIVLTGGAGFIGSAILAELNRRGRRDILVVDSFGALAKWRNLLGKSFRAAMHKRDLAAFLASPGAGAVEAIIHIGACSSTTETDNAYLETNNTRYTLDLAHWAVARGRRFIYASSAATYGDGEIGYDDDPALLDRLKPLNLYGLSKHRADQEARDAGLLDRIAGLKFFNVYGPNEYHKGAMMSVVLKAHRQILSTGCVRLFQSHRPDYRDGEQVRDFIYVKDCVAAVLRLLERPEVNGIFNLGTGQARSWLDLVHAVFTAMGRRPEIEFIAMPSELRDRYQYRTEAVMTRLRTALPELAFHSLEDGIRDYVTGFLAPGERTL